MVAGPVTRQMISRVIRVYEQVPEPKAVVAVGSCATSGGPFVGGYLIEGSLDEIVSADAYVVGCLPSPEAIFRGIVTAAKKEVRVRTRDG